MGVMNRPMTTRKRRQRAARRIERMVLVALIGLQWAMIDIETHVFEDGSIFVTGCITGQMCDDRP